MTIYVTKPFMPPIDEYMSYLDKIWDSAYLTNNGVLHNELEKKLCDYLDVDKLSLVCNATIALILALKSLDISGEVITTPYSFVATAHSLTWCGLTPVFVDINENDFNIDVTKIEAAITPRTTAIMPVHCYGNPCDVDAIQEIANKHSLRVIYDAAHCFAVRYKNENILKYGDMSVLSFHATKVFSTFEGGAIVCQDPAINNKVNHLRNFGFSNEVTIVGTGINGKMCEASAAFGLAQLAYIDEAILKRKEVDARYRQALADIKGVVIPDTNKDAEPNYSYFPVLITDESSVTRDDLHRHLRARNIISRRYFYPLISNIDAYRTFPSSMQFNLPIANRVASHILCLPIYPDLTSNDQNYIIDTIVECLN